MAGPAGNARAPDLRDWQSSVSSGSHTGVASRKNPGNIKGVKGSREGWGGRGGGDRDPYLVTAGDTVTVVLS